MTTYLSNLKNDNKIKDIDKCEDNVALINNSIPEVIPEKILNTNVKLEETTNVKTDIYTINSFTNPDKQYIVEYIKKLID